MAYNPPPNDGGSSSYLHPSSSIRSSDRPTSYFSTTASNRYFSDQALRSGYRAAVDSRESEFHRFPDLEDPVQREREKNRIREEIMAEQMERRRILEEEVRRELMMEREMTLKRWDSMHSGTPSEFREFVQRPSGPRYDAPEIRNSFHETSRPRFDAGIPEISQSLHEPPSRRFDGSFETLQYVREPARIPQPESYLEERRLPLLPTVRNHPVSRVGIFGSDKPHLMTPTTSSLSLRETKPSPHSSNLAFRGVKPPQEPVKERSLMAKREMGLSDPDRKRKVSVLGAGHHRPSDLDKKPKGSWNCKLCNIIATSEQALNDHLNGKKHKLMKEEAALTPHKAGNNSKPVRREGLSYKAGPSYPGVKNATNTNPSETLRAGVTLMGMKQTSETNETSRAELAKVKAKQKAKAMVDKKPMSKMNASVEVQGPLRKSISDGGPVRKFQFWCELCQVGANSETVLTAHYKGKRHLGNLEMKKPNK